MPDGYRRSGVALAVRHRLQWFIHLRAHGLRKGDELQHSFRLPTDFGPRYDDATYGSC